ncbi:hypothetical protein RND81_11G003300 [Saponaria officinalis]|uniref:Protein LAZY 1 n=1 Tax=Saponaria officinalis TaxID=3572 RepID=A0AAW1HGL5_SAPOF
MKLLTWMHRKFRQGNNETLREFPIGQPMLDDPHLCQKQNNANGTWRQVHRDGQARRSFASFETTKLADFEEKASAEFSEYFEGFLAIGTLGTEPAITEPETPTFDGSFDKLAEGETEVTENELRLINDELERVLAAEAKDDGWTDSSSRNSYVSNGRISHASVITLSGKPLEIPESTGNGNLNCPLQEYLLGSAVELPESPEKANAPKKENRTSLGELLEKHKAEEISETEHKRGGKRDDKEGEKTAMNLIKKTLKKKMASTASKNSYGTAQEATESTAADTKLLKILQKFHRKVHPECLIATEKPDKSHKIKFKDMIPCNGGCYKDKHTFPDDSQRARRIGHMRVSKSPSNSSQFTMGDSDSNGSSRECWIKTDADYLVLEL